MGLAQEFKDFNTGFKTQTDANESRARTSAYNEQKKNAKKKDADGFSISKELFEALNDPNAWNSNADKLYPTEPAGALPGASPVAQAASPATAGSAIAAAPGTAYAANNGGGAPRRALDLTSDSSDDGEESD